MNKYICIFMYSLSAYANAQEKPFTVQTFVANGAVEVMTCNLAVQTASMGAMTKKDAALLKSSCEVDSTAQSNLEKVLPLLASKAAAANLAKDYSLRTRAATRWLEGRVGAASMPTQIQMAAIESDLAVIATRLLDAASG